MKIKASVRRAIHETNDVTTEYYVEFEQELGDNTAFPNTAQIKECLDGIDAMLTRKQDHCAEQLAPAKSHKNNSTNQATEKQLAKLHDLMQQKHVTKEALMEKYDINDFANLTNSQCRPIIGDLIADRIPGGPENPF